MEIEGGLIKMTKIDLLHRIEWMLNHTTAYRDTTHETVPEAKIEELEGQFGFRLPDDYREFLATFGCIEGTIRIMGVPKTGWQSVYEATVAKKREHVLPDIIVVRQDDYGNFDYIDLNLSTPERSVVCSYTEMTGVTHITPYSDFHSYLLYALLVFENSERTRDELEELDSLIDAYIHDQTNGN